MRKFMNVELLNNIIDEVWEYHGYFDEDTYDGIMQVVRYALGMIVEQKLFYLDAIIYELGIERGLSYDYDIVNLIKKSEEEHKDEPEWLFSCLVFDDVYRYIERR